MTEYVLEPAAPPSVAIANSSQRFAVRRIFCVGRNYAAHAREMGKDPDREPPFFFTKPADAVVDDAATVAYPPLTENFHYEAEMVVAMAIGGVNIGEDSALEHVWGYAIGNDLTRRDLQLAARDMGRPWDWGKAFDPEADRDTPRSSDGRRRLTAPPYPWTASCGNRVAARDCHECRPGDGPGRPTSSAGSPCLRPGWTGTFRQEGPPTDPFPRLKTSASGGPAVTGTGRSGCSARLPSYEPDGKSADRLPRFDGCELVGSTPALSERSERKGRTRG